MAVVQNLYGQGASEVKKVLLQIKFMSFPE